MSDLRERIRAAMEMRLGFIQECRELLPLVLAEMDALRTELAECRAQNTSMAETMSGIRSNAVQLAAMTAERDEIKAERDKVLGNACQREHERTADMRRELRTLRAELEAMTAERDALRAALKRIAAWDCLNPPDRELCADHPWLKRLVDEALAVTT